MKRSPWMDDELALLADETAKFVARELLPHAERWESERVVDRDAWRSAGAAGLLCASIPAEYGGGGGTLAHEAVIAQAIVSAGLWGGFGPGNRVTSHIVAHYILSSGTDTQLHRRLPRIATLAWYGPVLLQSLFS